MDKLTYAPLALTLYDGEDNEIKTLSKSIVRWGTMKRALKLAKSLDGDARSLDADAIDKLTAFVCQVFDDKVTPQEIEDGADIAEVMTVFQAVMHRARSLGNG